MADLDGGGSRVDGRGVLAGAFALPEALRETGEAGLTAVVASGLPKATAHRLLSQLESLGATCRSDSRYTIGPRIFELG